MTRDGGCSRPRVRRRSRICGSARTTGAAGVDGVGVGSVGGASAGVWVGDRGEGGLGGVGAGLHRCLLTLFPQGFLSHCALPFPSTPTEPPQVFVARRRGGCRGARGVFRDPVGLREVVFGCEIVAGGFVPSYKNLCAIFAPVRNNLRLSGAGRHVVVDTDHAGEERHGAEVEVMSCCSSFNARSMGGG